MAYTTRREPKIVHFPGFSPSIESCAITLLINLVKVTVKLPLFLPCTFSLARAGRGVERSAGRCGSGPAVGTAWPHVAHRRRHRPDPGGAPAASGMRAAKRSTNGSKMQAPADGGAAPGRLAAERTHRIGRGAETFDLLTLLADSNARWRVETGAAAMEGRWEKRAVITA